MSSKGSARSVNAPAKTAGRTPAKQRRALSRKKKQQDKMLACQQAAQDVATYERLVGRISSVHRDCSDRIDWKNLATRPAPVEPRKGRAVEEAARQALADYAPTRIAKMIGQEAKKRLKLEAAVDAAVQQDAENFRIAHGRWLAAMEDWRRNSGLARKLVAGDPDSKVEAVRRFGRFAEISGIGSNIVVRVDKTGYVEATLKGHGKGIIPTEILSQLKSGKLSVKKMPKGKYNELHRKHICSCLLRVANELFSLLPDDDVIVTITDKLPHSATGELEDVPVLSACVVRETLDALDLNDIDPYETITTFVHKLSFGKIKGLRPIKPLVPGQVLR